MSIVQMAKANVGTGIELIAAGTNHDAIVQHNGIGAVLGFLTASVSVKVNTRSELVRQMRMAFPGLSKKCAKLLLNMVTGSDPEAHLLELQPDGTYTFTDAALAATGGVRW